MRLQAVCYAAVRKFNELTRTFSAVTSNSSTVADTPVGRVSDIECEHTGRVLLAIEVKDRRITIGDVDGTIRKARLANVSTILFLGSLNDGDVPEDVRRRARRELERGISIDFFDGRQFVLTLLGLFPGDRRAEYLTTVHDVLEEGRVPHAHKLAWSKAVDDASQ